MKSMHKDLIALDIFDNGTFKKRKFNMGQEHGM